MGKRQNRRKSPEGLPVDPLEWSAEDWRALNDALEFVLSKVAERHSGMSARDCTRVTCPMCKGTGRITQMPEER